MSREQCVEDALTGDRGWRPTATTWTDENLYRELMGMGDARAALRGLASAGKHLLARSAELPDTELGLLEVLVEYRYAVFAFVTATERL
jgi:hypothetical protein